jgi:alanyl-tRNA synthetase
VWYGLREQVGASEFLGYETLNAAGSVTAILKNGAQAQSLLEGETGIVIFNQTPFYAESGGQVGDAGTVSSPDTHAVVTDTQKKLGDVFAHHVTITKGALHVGASLDLNVDVVRRQKIRANHSATHLLHEALRRVLGDHIAQKGSQVSADRLRFDFSHPSAISPDDSARIEDIANTYVLQNAPVMTQLMDVEDAKESGARALFGEKYGDKVRVVSMGVDETRKAFSVELCGGTHVTQTGEIGLVVIVQEGAVASGVRRLEALTGDSARHYLSEMSRQLQRVASQLKTSVSDVPSRLEQVIEERRKLERDLADTRRKMALGSSQGQDDDVQVIAGVSYIGKIVQELDMKDVKGLVDQLKVKVGTGIVAVANTTSQGNTSLVVGITSDLISRFNAANLVREGSTILGGKGGGGRPDMAQGGGPDGDKAADALKGIAKALEALG